MFAERRLIADVEWRKWSQVTEDIGILHRCEGDSTQGGCPPRGVLSARRACIGTLLACVCRALAVNGNESPFENRSRAMLQVSHYKLSDAPDGALEGLLGALIKLQENASFLFEGRHHHISWNSIFCESARDRVCALQNPLLQWTNGECGINSTSLYTSL